jgi:hypothetical protein
MDDMNWNTILSRSDIDAHHQLTASLDPAFADRERAFYASRSDNQLRTLAAQSWNCNERTAYVLARSYLALRGALA